MQPKLICKQASYVIFCCVLVFFLPPIQDTAYAEDKITIGGIEDVVLLPWGISMKARIDTGAAISSLDVCEITRKEENEVEFRLSKRTGGFQLRLPVKAWKKIRSPEGPIERRPIVELEICLGSKRLRTEVTLNDRSHMDYPLLIGRKTLKGKFVVDVSRSYTLPPSCSKDLSP